MRDRLFDELLRRIEYQFDLWRRPLPPCGRSLSSGGFCEFDDYGCLAPGCPLSSIPRSS
jgi:hypothetical protein